MRTIALGLAALFAFAGAAPSRMRPEDHVSALAALNDVQAAIGEIVHIEDGYAVGHAAYERAAHRAMNAIVGRRDDGYAPAFGDPGDGIGTLGYLDRMLDQSDSSLWTPAVQGAKANVLAAAQNLADALGEKEMENYQADLTRAVANLGLVLGRPSQTGVLGGLSGALANTTLGVPPGGASVSGCSVPIRVPAYGVVAGRLTYVALPRSAASQATPDDLSISRVLVRGDQVVLYTHVANDAAALCRHASRFERARRVVQVAQSAASASSAPAPAQAPAAASAPALYASSQVQPGAAVYRQYCLQCHGADLQGTAGPSVAGSDFLKTAEGNGWTLSDVRTTVFQNMPFSDPGSLTPKQYADVMAFLLASNCYPAGTTPFPQSDSPSFAKVKIGAVPGRKPAAGKLGTCAP